MAREEIDQKIQDNYYDNPYNTGKRTVANILLAQPLIDSYVRSSYAKKTGLAFYHGLQTGHYNNFTFAGGNAFFGDGIFSKFGSTMSKSKSSFFSKIPFSNVGFQYINPEDSKKVKYFSEEVLKKHGGNQISDFIESGIGITKDRRGFFNTLRDQGFKLTESEMNNFSLSALKEKLYSHAKSASGENIIKLAKNLGLEDDVFKGEISALLKNGRLKRWSAKELAGAKASTTDISNILKKIDANDADTLAKVIKLPKIKSLLEKNTVFSQKTIEGLRSKVAEKMVSEYGEMSIMETLSSNKVTRFLTGNLLTGPVGTIATMGLAVAGSVSLMHQEAAINNYIKTTFSNYKDYDFIQSDTAVQSLQSHSMMSQSNSEDYVSIFKNHNVSKKYMKDVDPVEIDDNLSRSDNFTIF